jgi:hypothetical protein
MECCRGGQSAGGANALRRRYDRACRYRHSWLATSFHRALWAIPGPSLGRQRRANALVGLILVSHESESECDTPNGRLLQIGAYYLIYCQGH